MGMSQMCTKPHSEKLCSDIVSVKINNYITEGPLPRLLGARQLELRTGEDPRDVATHSGLLRGEGDQEASYNL